MTIKGTKAWINPIKVIVFGATESGTNVTR
jgi:hypothetical protein